MALQMLWKMHPVARWYYSISDIVALFSTSNTNIFLALDIEFIIFILWAALRFKQKHDPWRTIFY
jgi:hypothetical protein